MTNVDSCVFHVGQNPFVVSLWCSQEELSQEVFLGDGDRVRAEGQRPWEPQGQASAHNGDRLLPRGRT